MSRSSITVILAVVVAVAVVVALLVVSGCAPELEVDGGPSERVHAFYYAWYANPAVDGAYFHWNHDVLVRDEEPRAFPGGDDIGANYYPELGCYSSNDPDVVDRHVRELVGAGVGVLCLSWWGSDSFSGRAAPAILDAAARHGVGVCFHVEPFPGRNAGTSRDAIVHLIDRYGDHPGFYRSQAHGGRPFFYVYDSYHTPAEEWATVLSPDGANTIRGTEHDAVVIGLWVTEDEEAFMLDGHFDGIYTYFATDGFTYGSTAANWPRLADWARRHGKIFVPCVGPGYLDTRIRPWNAVNTRGREDGAYFDRMFSAAIDAGPDVVGVTSYNEWHEGTQIEPAVPKSIPGFAYEDYDPRPPAYYLARTKDWVGRFEATIDGTGAGETVRENAGQSAGP